MKKLLFFLVFVFLSSYVEGQWPPHHFGPLNTIQSVQNTKDRLDSCIDANLTVSESGNQEDVILLGCEENLDFTINFSNNCINNNPFIDGCNIKYELYFEDDFVTDEVLTGNANSINTYIFESYLGGWAPLNYPIIDEPTLANFEIRVIRECFGLPDIEIGNNIFLQVLVVPENATEYTLSYIDYPGIESFDITPCDWSDPDKIVMNNDGNGIPHSLTMQTIGRLDIATISTTSTGVSVDISLAGKLGLKTSKNMMPVFAEGSLGAAITGNYTLKDEDVETLLNRVNTIKSLTLQPDPCHKMAVGYEILAYPLLTQTFTPVCNGSDTPIGATLIDWIAVDYRPSAHCILPMQGTDCPPLPDIQFEKGNQNLVANTSCQYYIETTFEYDEFYHIQWSGPNDYFATTNSIYDLEVGIYNYNIVNECCEVIEGSIEICDDMEISAWVHNGEEWCRTLSCLDPVGTSENSVQDCFNTECVTPDNIIINVNQNGDCVNQYFYQGHLLGEEVVIVDSEINFNIETQKCQLIKMCDPNGSPNIISEESPTYGEWQFDEWDIKCFRATLCFNQVIEGQMDRKDPEIIEEWDDFFNRCDITYLCDDEEFEVNVGPYDEGEWEYDDWDNTCTREVQCTFDSEGTVTVEGEVSFDDWEYDDFWGDCIAQIYCDEEEMWLEEYSESPSSIGDWNTDEFSGKCWRNIYCPSAEEDIIQTIDWSLISDTSVDCPDGTHLGNIIYIYCLDDDTGEYFCSGGNLINDFLITIHGKEYTTKRKSSVDRIYPNPFNESLIIDINDIDFDNSSFTIKNVLGSDIMKGDLTHNINTGELKSGIYYLQIFTNQKLLLTKKIIKQ